MTRPRLSFGEVLSAGAGVVLVLSMFLPWFERETVGAFSGRSGSALDPGDQNAWQAFGLFAILIVLAAAVPVWQAVRRFRGDAPAMPMFAVAAGAVAVTLVLGGAAMKLGNEGGGGVGERVISTTAATGLVVGALAALLIAVGGVSAMWNTRPVGR